MSVLRLVESGVAEVSAVEVQQPRQSVVRLKAVSQENADVEKDVLGIREGIYVDVFSTLVGITGDFRAGGRIFSVNKGLIDYLNEQHNLGREVVVFSSDPEYAENYLKLAGAPGYFFPVLSKALFEGSTFEELIDDSTAQSQGFNVPMNYKHPDNFKWTRFKPNL